MPIIWTSNKKIILLYCKILFYYCLSQSTKQYDLYNYLLPPSYQGEIRVAEHLPCIAHIRGYEYLSVPAVDQLP